MNIHSTLTQLSRNIAIKYDTHGLTADGLQWLKTETFAGLYDSQYGPGVLINFSIGKMVVFEDRLIMDQQFRTASGCGRFIPKLDQGLFTVILMELADIHKEGWDEDKTIYSLKTAFGIAIEDIDRMAMGKANWRLDSAVVGMAVREVQHKHFKDSMWTAGAYGLLAVALVTASILDARTEA